jgi:Na+/H+ antiporter NhaC
LPTTCALKATPFAAELERKVRCHPEREIDPVQEILLQTISNNSLRKTPREKIMQYNIATILAVIAILFVLVTYITGAPLVPVAVILLALAIIFGGNTFRRV